MFKDLMRYVAFSYDALRLAILLRIVWEAFKIVYYDPIEKLKHLCKIGLTKLRSIFKNNEEKAVTVAYVTV